METFKWCIRPSFEVDNIPNTKEISFGDGYIQRQPIGINNLLRTYTVTVKVKRPNHLEVDKFFLKHKGVHAFYYQDPYTQTKKKVVCTSWPAKPIGLTHIEFSCTFKETR